MRPRIICHMISSIDGRLLTERWTPPASGVEKGIISPTYEKVAKALNADGWMVGRKTMEDFAKGKPSEGTISGNLPRSTYVADPSAKTFSVAIDPRGKLHYHTNTAEGNHVIAVLGDDVPDSYLHELQESGVSYLFAGPDGNDLGMAMERLAQDFSVRSILLEGGGIINGAFLKAGLIDEISLLIYPGIDGLAGVPSVFEYSGETDEKPASGQSLRHMSTATLDGGVVWLRYNVERDGA
ncbi:dihydrofolate reductase family protein [Caballeronia sp. LZ008]|uniref:dihydrofolate reductase family protein n=1 Tax=unclassified Caballeronia TaxID=2646786 RepID=UPI00253F7955|nr:MULTISPECIES: dihydrofolate reductase family protein [unclassified Caballeronia]MDR5798171.1 dihydrofolate reductase family protein [Caballeronia sp. LZ008]